MPEPEKDVTTPATPPVRSRRAKRNRLLWAGLWFLFALTVSIRFYNLASHEWAGYVHDGTSHAWYVRYVAEHHHLPNPDEDFEYPQQPLYYVLAAMLYETHESLDENITNLAPFGFCISVATLVVFMRALRFLSSWRLRYTAFIFMAFPPSFILTSGCIGNDIMAVFFGALFFYFVVRLNRNPGSRLFFIMTIVALFGALLTKMTGLVLLVALPWVFWRRARYDLSWKPTAQRVSVVAALGISWAAAVLYRAWSFTNHEFMFVHTWIWDYMEIKENLWVYATRFDLSSLIAAGHATTTDNTPDLVRFSFPTWEYGNMLLGEYEFAADPILLFCTRQLIIAGTVLLFGLVLFFFIALFNRPFWPWRKIFTLNRLALLLIAGSCALVLGYVHSVPNTCNADYRFQGVTFAWMAYCIGRGLSAFPRSRVWQTIIPCFLAFFVYSSLYFLTYLYIRR